MSTTNEQHLWVASDPPEWPAFAMNMNGDEHYTISDLWLQKEWVDHYPGNFTIKFLLRSENTLVKYFTTFLEIDSSWYLAYPVNTLTYNM